MGAGSSAEQRSPQDAAAAAVESQPSSPEAETPTTLEVAESEQPEDLAKLLQKNGQISSINGITEEQVELSLKPEELNGQQAEGAITDDVSCWFQQKIQTHLDILMLQQT